MSAELLRRAVDVAKARGNNPAEPDALIHLAVAKAMGEVAHAWEVADGWALDPDDDPIPFEDTLDGGWLDVARTYLKEVAVERGQECFYGKPRACEDVRCGPNCGNRFDYAHPCPACLRARIELSDRALAAEYAKNAPSQMEGLTKLSEVKDVGASPQPGGDGSPAIKAICTVCDATATLRGVTEMVVWDESHGQQCGKGER